MQPQGAMVAWAGPMQPAKLLLASVTGQAGSMGFPFRAPWDAPRAADPTHAGPTSAPAAHSDSGPPAGASRAPAPAASSAPPMPVSSLALAAPGARGSGADAAPTTTDGGSPPPLPAPAPRTAAQTWSPEPSTSSQVQQRDAQQALEQRPGGSRPFWLGQNPNGGGGAHEPLQVLHRHVSGEAGKLVGLLGTQLVLGLALLDRRLRNQQGGSDDDGSGGGGGGAPWRLRLPWQRAGDRDGGDGRDAAARQAPWQAAAAARQWAVKGLAAERALDLRQSLACYTNAVALDPTNVEYMCRLAKQWSDLTYEAGAPLEQIVDANTNAQRYGERAVALAPQLAAGHLALCVSQGRLALFSDNKTKVRLAKEAHEAAERAIQLEPDNDLAHHLKGRWAFEMAQINFVVRQLVRLLYGAALPTGSFQDALSEFGTAVALNPGKLIHRVEYGRTLLRLGHKQEALSELRHSLTLDIEDINAQLQREDAELLVQGLEKELSRTLPITWGFAAAGGGGGGTSSGSSAASSSSSAPPGGQQGRQ